MAATQARIARGQKMLAARGLEAPETCSVELPTFIIVSVFLQSQQLFANLEERMGVRATILTASVLSLLLSFSAQLSASSSVLL